MKELLLKLPWFRNWLADVWEDAWEQGATFEQSGGTGVNYDPPKNPYV